jgi:hypothetical protein
MSVDAVTLDSGEYKTASSKGTKYHASTSE